MSEAFLDLFSPFSIRHPQGGEGDDFLYFGRRGMPRWLLPVAHCNLDRVLSNWSPQRVSSQAKWTIIRTAHRLGVAAKLPGVRIARINSRVDWRPLGWPCDAAPLTAIYVGTPGVNRKAVVHLVEAESEDCRVIVKIPLVESAKAAIVHEADVLLSLADQHYRCAPRLLYVDRNLGISSQTVMGGKQRVAS